MSDDTAASGTVDTGHETTAASDRTERAGESWMLARRWTLAYHYADPSEYGIPELPTWTVRRTESTGLALARDESSEPFISASDPMQVRR